MRLTVLSPIYGKKANQAARYFQERSCRLRNEEMATNLASTLAKILVAWRPPWPVTALSAGCEGYPSFLTFWRRDQG